MTKKYNDDNRNFRDLGGWKTENGRVVTGLMFRSAHLDGLKKSEQKSLVKLGLGYAVDLRNEIEKAPADQRIGALLPAITVHNADVSDRIDAETMPAIIAALSAMKSASEARAWMSMQYAETVMRCRADMQNVLQYLMSRDRPAVFFCVAGKDRTGVIAAILLTILGVARADVLRDYDLTNKRVFGLPFWRRHDRSAKQQYNLAGVKTAVIDALADAHRDYINAAFAAIERSGGLDAYLDGIDASLLTDFRHRMVITG